MLIKVSNALLKVGIDLRRKLFKSVHEQFGGNLRLIVCGGAPMREELGRFFESIGVTITNGYGITECSPLVSVNRVECNDPSTVGMVLPCLEIKIENPDSDGIGEICVKGPVLALGYYGDQARTNDVFIQNPLNQNYRELIYKTGDLGSFNADGDLLFHGRKDRQIKHMGHRIELGEIETTASEIAGVDECCALYHKEKELLYLFYTGEATSKQIVLHFRAVLPAFMVPRKLVQLDMLPRLPNGKLDMTTLKTYFK